MRAAGDALDWRSPCAFQDKQMAQVASLSADASFRAHGNHWRSTFRGWRLVECAIRTCNRSLTKKRALSLQVRDPHDRDRVPIVVRLLFCVLVAGPDKVLLGRKGLSLLLDPKFPLGDMADHGIHHRGAGCLRSRLHNDIAH